MNTSLTPRPFQPDNDFAALLALRSEINVHDRTGTAVSEEALRQQLALPDRDPSQDRWVIASPDVPQALIAAAMVWTPRDRSPLAARFDIAVHPNWRRRGLGSQLLSLVLARAQAAGAASASAHALEQNPAGGAFLTRHTFRAEGAYTELRAPASLRLPSPVWPYGYRLSNFADVNDVAILTEAMNRCYEGLWGHQDVSIEQIQQWLPGFNPESLFLVFSEKGKVVGISRVEASPERSERNGVPTGYIDAPGIVSPHRRHDLYRALLITGVRWLQVHGQEIIEMESWGDRPDVLELYQQAGFSILRRVVSYRQDFGRAMGA